MNRFAFFVLVIAIGKASSAEPSLLAPPLQIPTGAPVLSELITDENGKPIATKQAWIKKRTEISNHWVTVLGELPKSRGPLKTELLGTEELEDCSRQHVRYQVEEGTFTDGYLLKPKVANKKMPAIVVFHPTTEVHAKGVAGLDPRFPEEKQQGLHLVRRGYVVWCPRNYINTEGGDWAANAARVQQSHPQWTGMTRMVLDALRAMDFLQTLDSVDPERIGCLGHSLGAKQVLYAMAFDTRYQAGVSSEGGIGLKFTNWDAAWYLGEKIREPAFQREHHEVLAMVAPRPFLLLAGDSADGDRSWAFLERVKPVYDLLGAPENIAWLNHHQGHNYPASARAAAESFLDKHLKKGRRVKL